MVMCRLIIESVNVDTVRLGELVTTHRFRKHYTVNRMHTEFGLYRKLIRNIESGDWCNVQVKHLNVLSEALNITFIFETEKGDAFELSNWLEQCFSHVESEKHFKKLIRPIFKDVRNLNRVITNPESTTFFNVIRILNVFLLGEFTLRIVCNDL